MSGAPPQAESNASTPYLLLGESIRRDVTGRLRECIERWRREWADERSPQFRLELHEARVQGSAAAWLGAVCFNVGAAQRPALMFIVPSQMTPWIVGVHVDGPRGGMDSPRSRSEVTIAARMEREALSTLARRIFDCATMEPPVLERGALTEAAVSELSAARYLHVSVWPGQCSNQLGLLISPALASGLLPVRVPVTSQERMEKRAAAITGQAITLEAVLGSAEISVADLARLAVGDVIVMNASLSEPAELRIRAGERIAAVSPGSCEGRRAVQIKSESRRGKS